MDAAELVAAVGRDPQGTAIFCDFDGTLAPIVPDPPDARALPAAVEALGRLAATCKLVAVVSGRPLAFLDPFLPPEVRLAALYGLEQRDDGVSGRHPAAEPWVDTVADALAKAQAELPAPVLVEGKSLSLTLHYRADPSLAPVVEAWAHEVAVRTGLEQRRAKMSVELHPPVDVDKGTTVTAWAEGARIVIFAGDDTGDLDAFAALVPLREAGVITCAVVVASDETPDPVPRRGRPRPRRSRAAGRAARSVGGGCRQLILEPVARAPGADHGPDGLGPSGPLGRRQVQRLVQGPGRGRDVEGVRRRAATSPSSAHAPDSGLSTSSRRGR